MNGRLWSALLVSGLVVLPSSIHGQQGGGSKPAESVNIVNSTEEVINQTFLDNLLTDPIDVARFKELRVAVWCSPGVGASLRLWLVIGHPDFEVVRIADSGAIDCNSGFSETVEVPGQTVRIHLSGSGRVAVYGRAN